MLIIFDEDVAVEAGDILEIKDGVVKINNVLIKTHIEELENETY